MDFSPLSAIASNGKVKAWSISVQSNPDATACIVTTWGYVDGTKQSNTKQITTGKNIGKKNETTPLQQATNDARSIWNKKRDEGYTESVNIQDSAQIIQASKGPNKPLPPIPSTDPYALLPMLALEYTKRGHGIVFPCYAQPKLDGVRCIYTNGNMYSRNGKRFPHLDHIVDELECPLILDGELYSSTLSFQRLVGLVKKPTLTDADRIDLLEIKFMVFDHIGEHAYSKRNQDLEVFFSTPLVYTKVLHTDICPTKEDVGKLLFDYEHAGYEGLILRNMNGVYKNKHRSKDLQKLKSFQDAEYKIVAYTEGEGLEKGCVVWICETEYGKTFSVRPKGTRVERSGMFENGCAFIGKMLTVKYQELTKDGIPRFPVGIGMRDYE